MKKLNISLICGSSLLLTAISSYGNSSDQTAEIQIEEVIVTAQRRDENLLSVPIAISVIDGKFIENNGAFGLSELESAIPSLNFGRGGRKTRGEIAIRGVGGFARNIGTGGRVLVYVDDVPLGRSSSFDVSLADVKQIEVLKGPQGTLFGANTIAGAVNITTMDASEDFNVRLRADYGQRGYLLQTLKTNLALTDTLFGRLQLSHKESNGYIENSTNSKDLQGSDLNSLRFKLLLQASDRLTIKTSFDWLEDKAAATNAEALSDTTSPFSLSGYSDSPEPHQVSHDADEFEERKNWGSAVKVEYRLPSDASFISITAYRNSEFREQSEEDYSALPLATSLFDEDYSQWTQELRYTSALEDTFDYVVGVFLQSSDISTQRNAQIVLGPTNIWRVDTPGELKTSSYSVFGNMNYRFSDTLELTLGARYERESKEIDYSISDTTPFFTNGRLADKQHYPFFLPKIALNYEADDSGLIYASIAKGAKSGGWNADFVPSLEDLEFDSEHSINYEIGYKNSVFDDSLIVLAAVFHTKFTDFQVSQFIETLGSMGGAHTIRNAGEATSKGVELDLQYFINENIELNFNTAYVDAKFDRFKNGDDDGTDYSNHTLPYAPRWTSFVSINIDYPLSSEIDGFMQLSYSYSDGYFSDPKNDDATERVDNFHVVNAHIGVNIGRYLDISIWGKNITDETYLRFKGISFLGVQRGYYEAPRTVGVSVRALID